jgi:GT2 family glycosyltransferase
MALKVTLIICTYKRAESLHRLLQTVDTQTKYPDTILIIDGSLDDQTEVMLQANSFANLVYFRVTPEQRGLTKQRNFGIHQVQPQTDVVCFLDDDVLLEPNYFEALLQTYAVYPEALGVGGYITNETKWIPMHANETLGNAWFAFDGWKRNEPLRNKIRRKLGLDADVPPGCIPMFSHGRSVGFLPPSGKIYPVQQFMGGVSSFRKSVFDRLQFSHYFEGYGLYEDADFTSRLSKLGPLYLNTAARLSHHHDFSGRPNAYKYGRMVVRNGWYVWRVYAPQPGWRNRVKWNLITAVLIAIRFSNIFTATNRMDCLRETLGRLSGWLSLFVHQPKIEHS